MMRYLLPLTLPSIVMVKLCLILITSLKKQGILYLTKHNTRFFIFPSSTIISIFNDTTLFHCFNDFHLIFLVQSSHRFIEIQHTRILWTFTGLHLRILWWGCVTVFYVTNAFVTFQRACNCKISRERIKKC